MTSLAVCSANSKSNVSHDKTGIEINLLVRQRLDETSSNQKLAMLGSIGMVSTNRKVFYWAPHPDESDQWCYTATALYTAQAVVFIDILDVVTGAKMSLTFFNCANLLSDAKPKNVPWWFAFSKMGRLV